jgi:AcrR family transcriptional regulator
MSVDTRPRLDRDSRREAILEVAAAVFMEVGYSAASMSTIAARLGGSKGTLYNYFRSKEELFAAYIDRHCAWQQETLNEMIAQGLDVRDALTNLGRTLLVMVLSGYGLRNFVLVVAESGRAPEIGRAFYEAGPLRGAARLTEFLAKAVAAGRLRPCDPAVAAHQFVGLCQNRLLKARLCNAAPEPTPAEIDAEVAAAVDTFMAAFGPVPGAASGS